MMSAESTKRMGRAERARSHRVPVLTGGGGGETPSCVPSTTFSDSARADIWGPCRMNHEGPSSGNEEPCRLFLFPPTKFMTLEHSTVRGAKHVN